MGKLCKVVVCGQGAVGKTAVLEQIIFGNHVTNSVGHKTSKLGFFTIKNHARLCLQSSFSTIEDIFVANITTDATKNTKETVHFYDTAGLVKTYNLCYLIK